MHVGGQVLDWSDVDGVETQDGPREWLASPPTVLPPASGEACPLPRWFLSLPGLWLKHMNCRFGCSLCFVSKNECHTCCFVLLTAFASLKHSCFQTWARARATLLLASGPGGLTAGLLVCIQAAQAQSLGRALRYVFRTAPCSPSETLWSGVSSAGLPRPLAAGSWRSLSPPRVWDFLSHVSGAKGPFSTRSSPPPREGSLQPLRCKRAVSRSGAALGSWPPGLFHRGPLQLLQRSPHTRPPQPLNCDGPSKRSASRHYLLSGKLTPADCFISPRCPRRGWKKDVLHGVPRTTRDLQLEVGGGGEDAQSPVEHEVRVQGTLWIPSRRLLNVSGTQRDISRSRLCPQLRSLNMGRSLFEPKETPPECILKNRKLFFFFLLLWQCLAFI